MTFTRNHGFAPLGSYGALADGQAAALLAADGSVDWFAAPRLDAAPVCAALLDPEHGGAITLAPTVGYAVAQRYVEDTMVLETTFRTEGGTVVVTDALTVGAAGRLPWTELARRVETHSGEGADALADPPRASAGHRTPVGAPPRAGVPMFKAGDVQRRCHRAGRSPRRLSVSVFPRMPGRWVR